MNKNHDNIKKTFSNIRPSDECVERIINMTKENKNTKRIKFVPALAIVACMAILVTGILGSVTINSRTRMADIETKTTQNAPTANNFFAITAYAKDGEEKTVTELNDDKVVIQDYKLSRQYDSDGILELRGNGDSGFSISGKNIKSVNYKCKNGYISFVVDSSKIEYLIKEGKYYDVILPYLDEYKNLGTSQMRDVFAEHFENGDYDEYFKEVGKKSLDDYKGVKLIYNDDDTEIIGVGVISNEVYDSVACTRQIREYTFVNYNNMTEGFAEIYWVCNDSETEKLLKDINMGYDELPHDTLTITVEFNDGSKQIANYDLSFNKKGNMVIEKLK